MTVPIIPIPVLAAALIALTIVAFLVVAALRDTTAPEVQDFVCRLDPRGGRWRWRITEPAAETITDRVPFSWGTEDTQEAAMRAGHESFARWASGRPDPGAYRLLFVGEGVDAEWVT
jgi:hypothetical protein